MFGADAEYDFCCAQCGLGITWSLKVSLQGGTLSRCPVVQYSAWLDQHSREETLRGIRSALDASPADALQAARDDGLLDLLHQLCGPPL